MTAWPTERVIAFARRAGWRQPELTTAVAVALAASNGNDHTIIAVPPPPMIEYVGLWLVPAGEYSGRSAVELLDPDVNAATTRRLWLAAGGDWSWNHAYRSGRWRWRLQEAAQRIARPRLFTDPSPVAQLGHLAAASSQLDLETTTQQRKAPQWLTDTE